MSALVHLPAALVLPTGVLPSAAVAYVHYLSFMVCFGALVLERRLIRPDPDRSVAITMVITDIVYGIAALLVLLSGILRVLHYGQGSSFYTENPLFWWKVGVYLSVGALSLYPTVTYILWALPLRKGSCRRSARPWPAAWAGFSTSSWWASPPFLCLPP